MHSYYTRAFAMWRCLPSTRPAHVKCSVWWFIMHPSRLYFPTRKCSPGLCIYLFLRMLFHAVDFSSTKIVPSCHALRWSVRRKQAVTKRGESSIVQFLTTKGGSFHVWQRISSYLQATNTYDPVLTLLSCYMCKYMYATNLWLYLVSWKPYSSRAPRLVYLV